MTATVEAKPTETKATKSAVRRYSKSGETPQQREATPEQAKQLDNCEKRIALARSSCVDLIDALHEIETAQPVPLYRFSHDTMNKYVAAKWDIEGSTMSRYRNAHKVLTVLREAGIDVKPADPKQAINEGQLRAAHDYLKVHGAEKLVTLWKQLAEGGERITAAAIDATAGKPKPSDKQKTLTGLLKSVTFLARQKQTGKNKGNAYLSAVAECTVEDSKALHAAIACQSKPDKASGTFAFSFGELDADEVFNKVGGWAMKRDTVKAVSLNFVRGESPTAKPASEAPSFPKK